MPSVETAQRQIAELAVSRLDQLREKLLAQRQTEHAEQSASLAKLAADNAEQAREMERRQAFTLEVLTKEQTACFRTGLLGLLDRLSGRRKRLAEENRVERDKIRRAQEHEKATLQVVHTRQLAVAKRTTATKTSADETLAAINKDIEALREQFAGTNAAKRHRSRRARDGPSR